MKIATGKVRLSYANIWTPKGFNGQPEKYSASLIIPKSDTKTVKKIKDAIAAMMKDQENITTWGKATNLHLPLRDGDTDRSDDPAYEGCYFMNASTPKDGPPRIVDRNKQEIIDHAEVYSGCYAQVVINLYAYNKNGNKGIGAGLSGIRKLADGEPLSGGMVSDADFTDDFSDDVDDLF